MEEKKFFKVTAPEGYEIDKVNSTLEDIVFKKVEQEQSVKNWKDLIGKKMPNSSSWIVYDEVVQYVGANFLSQGQSAFVDKRHAKSALAMAQISQLIPYFGGRITDEEWGNSDTTKYVITRTEGKLDCTVSFGQYFFLAFHAAEQRDNFLKYNERLVKNYLMLD